MATIERKMSFPCRNELDAIVLGLELITKGAIAGDRIDPDPKFEHKDDHVVLNATMFLTEEQDAMFRELEQLINQTESMELPVTFAGHPTLQ